MGTWALSVVAAVWSREVKALSERGHERDGRNYNKTEPRSSEPNTLPNGHDEQKPQLENV